MNHSVFGRKLSRTKNQRMRLFSNLVRDLVIHDRISTSVAKAKAVQPLVEKLITKAKKGTDADRRNMLRIVADKEIIDMLISDAKDRFAKRNGGYTRIIKTGEMRKDATHMAFLSFVDEKIQRVQAEVKAVESKTDAPKKEESKTKEPVEKKSVKKPAKKTK